MSAPAGPDPCAGPTAGSTAGYTTRFYEAQRRGSHRSAAVILPIVLDRLRPRSVVDVGCGIGTWLAECLHLGVAEVVGLDGDHVDPTRLEIPGAAFRPTDLEQRIHQDRAFDLAVSVEVAEHLDPARADSFVADLTRLAPVVCFGAAIPGQGGVHHVNEQWPGYWVERFADQGFTAIDCLRPAVWDVPACAHWYAQNTLLYVDATRPDLIATFADLPRLEPAGLALVHPRYLTRHAEAIRVRGARQHWIDALVATRRAVARRLRPRRTG